MSPMPGFIRIALGALLLAVGLADAQQPAKTARIGFLSGLGSSVIATRLAAFHEGLRELGYVDRKNILIEYRWADTKLDRLPHLAAELVRVKVDLIVTTGPPATRAAAVVGTSMLMGSVHSMVAK